MKYIRKTFKSNESTVIVIPIDIAKYLELNVGDEIVIQDDEGTHGKFVSFWKKDTKPRPTKEIVKEVLNDPEKKKECEKNGSELS